MSAADAVAVQISDEPNCVFARCTRVQVRPAPLIVRFWPFTACGPSDAANAMSTSPVVAVLKAAVVRLPRPSENTIFSTAGAGPGGGGGGGGGGAALLTVTATAAEVAALPAASRAVAERLCVEPFAYSRESHVAWYGDAVSSTPIAVVPSKNDTPATPTLSDADAVIVTTPDTVPAAGAVMLTVGAMASPPTVTFTRPTVVSPMPSMISYVKTSEPANPARAVYVYGSAPVMAPPFALVAAMRFTRSE